MESVSAHEFTDIGSFGVEPDFLQSQTEWWIKRMVKVKITTGHIAKKMRGN